MVALHITERPETSRSTSSTVKRLGSKADLRPLSRRPLAHVGYSSERHNSMPSVRFCCTPLFYVNHSVATIEKFATAARVFVPEINCGQAIRRSRRRGGTGESWFLCRDCRTGMVEGEKQAVLRIPPDCAD